jgi:hypothetical protein
VERYCRTCCEAGVLSLLDECGGCDAMLCPVCDQDHECVEWDDWTDDRVNESDIYDYPKDV